MYMCVCVCYTTHVVLQDNDVSMEPEFNNEKEWS